KLIESQEGGANTSEVDTEVDTALKSMPGVIRGTVGYMSPEQAHGDIPAIDHRSDIFSFGCLLYEAVTRQRAFAGRDQIDSLHKIVHGPTPRLDDLNAEVPVELQKVVARCLAKRPDARYQSIKDVAIELKQLRRKLDSLTADLSTAGSIHPEASTTA